MNNPGSIGLMTNFLFSVLTVPVIAKCSNDGLISLFINQKTIRDSLIIGKKKSSGLFPLFEN